MIKKALHRFQTDGSFRLKAIFLLIVVFMIWGNTHPKQTLTEEGCNAIFDEARGGWTCWAACIPLSLINAQACLTCGGWAISNEAFNACEAAGCHVEAKYSGEFPLGLDDVSNCMQKWIYGKTSFAGECTLGVKTGGYVFGNQAGCTSQYGIESPGKICGKTVYHCQTPPDPDQTCSEGEKSIAKILWPAAISSCKTAYLLVLVGGGILALLIILLALSAF